MLKHKCDLPKIRLYHYKKSNLVNALAMVVVGAAVEDTVVMVAVEAALAEVKVPLSIVILLYW